MRYLRTTGEFNHIWTRDTESVRSPSFDKIATRSAYLTHRNCVMRDFGLQSGGRFAPARPNLADAICVLDSIC